MATVAVVVYLAIAALAYLPAWPGDPHLLVTCACGDPVQQSWLLGWFPWAVVHGHNPYFTNWIDYPSGVNLAVNTGMPLLGVVTAPLSLAVSPLASYSLLLYLAYPISATAAFFVLRRWSGSNIGAFLGGLLYGFSPYMIGQGQEHLNLCFVPIPPQIFAAVFELCVAQKGNPRRQGAWFGALVVAQFFISVEVLLSTLVIATIGIVVLLIARRRALGRNRLAYALRALPLALAPCVLVGYPVYYALAGPRRWNGPAFPIDNLYRADLLGVVVPTTSQLVSPGASLGNRFALGAVENGSYIGIPLVLVAALGLVWRWRDPWVRFAAALALVGYVLSLGPHLVVAAHATPVPMPFWVLAHVPVLDNLLPVRFSLYTMFFVSLLVARLVAPMPFATRVSDRRKALYRLTTSACVVCVLVSLLPNWPNREVKTSSAVASYLTATSGTTHWKVVLAYPYPNYPVDVAMLWQLQDAWRWKLIGGYALVPVHSRASELPLRLSPYSVQRFLENANGSGGACSSPGSADPPANGSLARRLRVYALRNAVSTVVFAPCHGRSTSVLSELTTAFGRPSVSMNGIEAWHLRAGIRGG